MTRVIMSLACLTMIGGMARNPAWCQIAGGGDLTVSQSAIGAPDVYGRDALGMDAPALRRAPLSEDAARTIRSTGAWQAPTSVTELFQAGVLNSTSYISPDGLTMLIASNRAGGFGLDDILVTTRTDKMTSFTTPVNLGAGVNSPLHDAQASMTEDGLELFLVRSPGSWFSNDLYHTTRTATSQPFGAAVALSDLNTSVADAYPFISPDGTTLYFTSSRGLTGDIGDIWRAVRPDRSTPFAAPQKLAGVNSSQGDFAFSIRADGLAGYLCSYRPGGTIYETTRASTAVDFGMPAPIPEVVSSDFDTGPSVTADGSELYFCRQPSGATVNYSDIMRAAWLPTNAAVDWMRYR
jgi:hypothetical protein